MTDHPSLSEQRALIERLRRTKTEHRVRQGFGGMIAFPDESETREVPVNPDGSAAADLIERLAFARPPASGVDRDFVRGHLALFQNETVRNAIRYARTGEGNSEAELTASIDSAADAILALTNSGPVATSVPFEGHDEQNQRETAADLVARLSEMLGDDTDFDNYSFSIKRGNLRRLLKALTNSGAPVPGDGGLSYGSMPAYGRADFKQLREAVAEACRGDRVDDGLPEDLYPGHHMVAGINYNSLSRIVTAFVDAALAHAAPAPSVEAETYRQMHDIATRELGYPSILEALEATPHAIEAGVPAGMVLVPVEPTALMLEEAWRAARPGTPVGRIWAAMLVAAPKQATPTDEAAVLADHIREQITHVQRRIEDGRAMGAAIWRIALEDVVRENKAILARPAPGSAGEASDG